MKKNGFTLMEVMLSIILFSLMVGAILGAYTSIQRANLKTANTQEAIQVAEDFLERINDMSMEYSIDTTKYSSGEYEPISYWQIINTGALHLKNESGDTTSFYSNNGIKTGLYMKNPSGTEINLINNDKVSISKLNFEIYPREQYVNANITATVQGGESLFKSGVTLSTTIGFKYYTFYAGEITPETLCEDICSVAKMQSSAMSNAGNGGGGHHHRFHFNNVFKNNTSMSSCTLGYQSKWVWNGRFPRFTRAQVSVYDMAYGCENGGLSGDILSSRSCERNCPRNSSGVNPFSCSYIRNLIVNGTFTGSTCSGYDEYVWNNACKDMCLSTIFTCTTDEENEVIKRTGIRMETGDYAGLYLQNPKIENQNGTRYYTDKTGSDENCVCNISYGYSIYASGGVVEAGACAGGKEKTTESRGFYSHNYETEYVYSPKNITYILADGTTGKWRGVESKANGYRENYYGGYRESFNSYNNCECTNSLEYQTCLSSGCCESPFQEKKAYEITNSSSCTDNGITNAKKALYCTGMRLQRNSQDNSCYVLSTNLWNYCIIQLSGTIINGTNECKTGNLKINLKSYCTNTTGLNGTRYKNNDKWICYQNKTGQVRTNNEILQYYCEQSNDRVRYNNGCRKNTDNCMKTYCVKESNSVQGCNNDVTSQPLYNGRSFSNYCSSINYDECIKGEGKNIFKDYDYTCNGSITDQSSIIMNIIDNIGKVSKTNSRRYRRRRWRF